LTSKRLKSEREIFESSRQFHRKKIQSDVFEVWKQRLHESDVKKQDLSYVTNLKNRQTLLNSFLIWQSMHLKLDFRSKERQAQFLHSQIVLENSFKTWQKALYFKSIKNDQNKERMEKYLLKKIVDRWKNICENLNSRRSKAELLSIRRHNEKLRIIVVAWQQRTIQNRPIRYRENQAILEIKQFVITHWLAQVQESKSKFDIIISSRRIHVFTSWQNKMESRKALLLERHLAEQHYEKSLLRNSLQTWKDAVFPRINFTLSKKRIILQNWLRQVQILKIAKTIERERLKTIFCHWRSQQDRKARVSSIVADFSAEFRKKELERVFDQWQTTLIEHQRLEHETNIAVWFWAEKHQRKFFKAWSQTSKTLKCQRLEKSILLEKRQKEADRKNAIAKAERIRFHCEAYADKYLYSLTSKSFHTAYVLGIRWRKLSRERSLLLKNRIDRRRETGKGFIGTEEFFRPLEFSMVSDAPEIPACIHRIPDPDSVQKKLKKIQMLDNILSKIDQNFKL